MKTILYILIAVIIGSSIVTGIPLATNNAENIVILECSEDNADAELLNRSAEIISNKLKNFGTEHFEIMVSTTETAIHIRFDKADDLDKVRELLTANGKLEFCETFDRNEIIAQVKHGDKIFSLLNSNQKEKNLSPAILGSCSESNKTRVNDYISTSFKNQFSEDIRFAWGKKLNDDNNISLYLLNSTSAIDGSFVVESTGKYYQKADKADLQIMFSKEGGVLWKELTQNNINNPIAMVIDNIVVHAPIVKTEISGGKCILSGDFSKDEVNRITALINNGELPIDLSLVE